MQNTQEIDRNLMFASEKIAFIPKWHRMYIANDNWDQNDG